jgi:hypothetical protein
LNTLPVHSTYITDAIADRNENDTEAAFFGYRRIYVTRISAEIDAKRDSL